MYMLFISNIQTDDLRVGFLEKMHWVDVYRVPGTMQTQIDSYHVRINYGKKKTYLLTFWIQKQEEDEVHSFKEHFIFLFLKCIHYLK